MEPSAVRCCDGNEIQVGNNPAIVFVDPPYSEIGMEMDVLIIGEHIPARVCAPCLYDPENARVRA